MKNLGRKWSRTCLCILLVVVCLGTSFVFYTESKAQDEVVDTFYVLDEDGNPVTVEVTRGDLERDFETRGISLFSRARTGENTRAVDVGVVRFKSLDANNGGVVYYTEVDTGRQGYFNCMSAGDAAYIRTESDGSVICKLSGVVMKVPAGNVKEIVSYNSGQKISYYYVADNGYLIHCYTYYSGDNLCFASTRVGYKTGYMERGVNYYSYDGHYFYKDFAKMISDYRNGNYKNAVNANAPYYNYYQYLSMHTTASFTAEQYNAHVIDYATRNNKKSVMISTGGALVSTQNTYTVNAMLLFGIAINESGWGTNKYSAAPYNNLFSIDAVDSNPDSAKVFATQQECVNQFAYYYIQGKYLKGTDWRYRGPHLGDKHSGINVKYASDPYWGEKAAARGYYFDTEKVDYGRYSIGIAKSGIIKCYKEANTDTKIYTTSASDDKAIYDFPVTVLGEVVGRNNEKYYKIASDMSLKDDRSARNVDAIYNSARDYVYVKASDIQIVFDGSNNIVKPQPGTPSTPENQGKTQAEVLSALKVKNSENFLSGFTVGSDVANLVAKVRALDSNIQVVIKKSNGTQITSGTIATGMQMTITTGGSTVSYTFVIKGDVNGDGKMSAIDYVMLRNYLDGKSSLSGAYLKSADTKSDGKVSALDYVLLRNHLDSKSTIVQ